MQQVTETMILVFGQEKQVNLWQMCARTVVIALVCLALIRISGRRSFGMNAPIDNMVVVLLGAVLSRTIVGASPVLPTIASCVVLTLLHKLFGWLGIYSDRIGRIVKGEAIVVYEKGKFVAHNMKHCLVTEKDIMNGVRLQLQEEDLSHVEKIFVERNGQISVIRKKEKYETDQSPLRA